MSELRVRPAEPGEAELIAEFQQRMARESEDFELDPAVVGAGVRAVFDDPAKGRYWVCDDADGNVLGSLLTTFEWSDWRNGTVWWIQSVYVLPEARRRGVFRRLYEHLKAEVEASPELRGLRLYVDHDNVSAQRVYRSVGMADDHYALYEWLVD